MKKLFAIVATLVLGGALAVAQTAPATQSSTEQTPATAKKSTKKSAHKAKKSTKKSKKSTDTTGAAAQPK